MTKTDEFRIKESEGVFSVQRKCITMVGDKNTFYGEIKTENWHTYFGHFQENISFLFHNIERENGCIEYFKTPFASLESAKDFIKSELAHEESKTKESVIYHTYP